MSEAEAKLIAGFVLFALMWGTFITVAVVALLAKVFK